MFANCNWRNRKKRKPHRRGRQRRRSRELRKPMNSARTLRERTPSGSPHRKITSGQLYRQPVPGTVVGQDGAWSNLYLRAVPQFRMRPHVADSARDEMRMQTVRRDPAKRTLSEEQNSRRPCRVARMESTPRSSTPSLVESAKQYPFANSHKAGSSGPTMNLSRSITPLTQARAKCSMCPLGRRGSWMGTRARWTAAASVGLSYCSGTAPVLLWCCSLG